jgi:hypothetical protein
MYEVEIREGLDRTFRKLARKDVGVQDVTHGHIEHSHDSSSRIERASGMLFSICPTVSMSTAINLP